MPVNERKENNDSVLPERRNMPADENEWRMQDNTGIRGSSGNSLFVR